MNVRSIAARVRAGLTTAEAETSQAMTRIAEGERSARPLHAFLSFDSGVAAAQARSVDGTPCGDGDMPLRGVPIAIKDNICTLDFDTTCASRLLEGYRSPYEATAVRRLRAAGAVIVGKTNLDEFSMGSSTENSAYGPTLNPHDATRVPGGSSGGSAAAVAAGWVPAALGSETGGSVRQPAAFCGIVGLKPSYGRVSRYGLIAFASSLDQIGVCAATVRDSAAVLEVIAGADALDATCAQRPMAGLVDACDGPLEGLVVGVPAEYFPAGLDDGIRARCDEALAALRAAGATIKAISLPHTVYAIPAYYLIASSEASSNLARFDGVRFGKRVDGATPLDVYVRTRSQGFGAEVKRRIMLGTFALSAGYVEAYYGRAQQAQRCIARDFERVFASGVDVVFTPTTPSTAFRFGEKTGDPYAMYLSDMFTVTANLAGLPAISVPVGGIDGLPVGVQFMAPRWREDMLLRAAAGLERAWANA